MRGRRVCPWKDSSISPSTSVTSSSTSWTKFAHTCPGGSVHTVQLNPRSAYACDICDSSMVFSSQGVLNTRFADARTVTVTVIQPGYRIIDAPRTHAPWVQPLGLLLEDSVPDITRMWHPICHAGRSSFLTYGTHNGRIDPPSSCSADIAMFRH